MDTNQQRKLPYCKKRSPIAARLRTEERWKAVNWTSGRFFAALLFVWTFQAEKISAQSPSGKTDPALLVSQLMSMVDLNGWHADLGRMCVAMKLGPEADCKFKQISVSQDLPDTTDNHGFNVPLTTAGPFTYAVIFHNGPLVGNFFVVSRQGELKASFYRAKGVDYTEIPIADSHRAFETSMTFWNDNLQTLKEEIARGNLPKR